MVVRTPAFGTGIVSERRPDGINVVTLPWGTVYLDQNNLGTVRAQSNYSTLPPPATSSLLMMSVSVLILCFVLQVVSSQYKRNRYDESDEPDASQQSSVRRRADERNSRQQQQPPFHFEFPTQPQQQPFSSFSSSTSYPPFQFGLDSPAPMMS